MHINIEAVSFSINFEPPLELDHVVATNFMENYYRIALNIYVGPKETTSTVEHFIILHKHKVNLLSSSLRLGPDFNPRIRDGDSFTIKQVDPNPENGLALVRNSPD